MSAVYIVAEIGWEYNDEGYYRGRGGPAAKRAFESLDDAVAECDRQNLQRMRQEELYSYVWEDMSDELKQFLENNKDTIKVYDHEFYLTSKTPDNVVVEAFRIANVSFYEVLQMAVE